MRHEPNHCNMPVLELPLESRRLDNAVALMVVGTLDIDAVLWRLLVEGMLRHRRERRQDGARMEAREGGRSKSRGESFCPYIRLMQVAAVRRRSYLLVQVV